MRGVLSLAGWLAVLEAREQGRKLMGEFAHEAEASGAREPGQ